MKRMLCALAGLATTFLSLTVHADRARATELGDLRSQKVPTDVRESYTLVAELQNLRDPAASTALRVWLWRRDLLALQGASLPQSPTVEDAIASPQADEKAYREAAAAYVDETFTPRCLPLGSRSPYHAALPSLMACGCSVSLYLSRLAPRQQRGAEPPASRILPGCSSILCETVMMPVIPN